MSAEGPNGTATARDVAHCYRVFLGREAENQAVIDEKVGQDRSDVLAAFVTSGEFGSQVFYRMIDGLPPATPLHDRPADADSMVWIGDLFGPDAARDERLARAGSGLVALAAAGGEPAVLAMLERRFGSVPTAAFAAALQAGAARVVRQAAADDIVLTLGCGPMLFGAVRRIEGGSAAAVDADVWDFGLADFARLCGLDDFAITTTPRDGASSVFPLSIPRAAGASDPLALRRALAPTLRLADLWFADRRQLALRFEGDGTPLTIDAYQCPIGGRPVKLAAAVPVGGAVAIVPIRLLGPFSPVLIVVRDPQGAIRSFDHIPFPSLARGGLHAAERAICGNGGDDVSDMAALSADLLAPLLRRDRIVGDTVAAIEVDPAADKGTEPIYDSDLLDYLATQLGVAVTGGGPGAIADQLARFCPASARAGATLLLPADAVPSLSALIRPLPPRAAPQTVTGSFGIVDWDRQGSVHSVWVPPVGAWVDDLQWRGARLAAPMIRIGEGGPGDLALSWPLAIAIRAAPLALGNRSPFEIAAEIEPPLLRGDVRDAIPGLDIVVLFEEARVSPIPLLESIVRQQGLSGAGRILVCRPAGTADPAIVEALDGLFPGRGRIVELRAGAGRLEQLAAVRAELTADLLLVADAATLLTDHRTVATLATMMTIADVASAGCLIRTVSGDRRIAAQGGYALSHADLRATPSLGFSPADIGVTDAPVTLPVAANAMAAMLLRRSLLDALPAQGAEGAPPAEDDILLGLAALGSGMLNLCTSVVSAHSERPAPHGRLLGRALPYRLDARTIDRLVNATTVIQRIR